MRGSVEAVAVARDVASSSPSKNTSALDMMSRYQRISPDCLPVANGSGSGNSTNASRKPAAQEPRSSTDVQDAPADSSARLASHLATVSLEQHKPARARALLPTPGYPPAGIVIRDHGHQPTGFANYTAPNPTGVIGSSSIAAPDGSVRLQWGHNKRSRGRREAPLLPTPATAPLPVPETPAQARRRASIKIHRRAAAAPAPAPAEKLMPPPSAPRGGLVIRVAPSLPPRPASVAPSLPARPASVAAADALQGRVVAALSQHRSAAEPRAAAVAEPHGSPAKQPQPQPQPPPQQHSRPQRQLTEKDKGKGPAVPEPPRRPQPQPPRPQPLPPHQQQPAAEVLKLAARPEMPRIVTTLTRKEKEEDFLAMKGTKLPVRPKKRTKAVEAKVSNICPGQWLSDVTRSRYMVREKRSKKDKRKGGLKAMDSDSD